MLVESKNFNHGKRGIRFRWYGLIPLLTVLINAMLMYIGRSYVKDYNTQDILFLSEMVILVFGFCIYFYFVFRDNRRK